MSAESTTSVEQARIQELEKAVRRAKSTLEMMREDDAAEGRRWGPDNAANLVIESLYTVLAK